jgi:hypothetical protein
MAKILRAPMKKVCRNPDCGDSFVPYRFQVYCCTKCKMDHYNSRNDIAGRMRKIRRKRKEEAANLL